MCISALIRPRRDDPPVVPTSRWRQILQFSFHLLIASGTQNLYNDSAQMVSLRCWTLLGMIGVGLLFGSIARAQAPDTPPDTSRPWHDDAWTNIVEQQGVRIDYIYYPEADNEHDGVVVRLTNTNDGAVRYAFTLIFRAPAAETSAVVRGRLEPGQMKTGDDASLFWVPFRQEDRSLAEIGLRGLRIRPVQNPRSGPT